MVVWFGSDVCVFEDSKIFGAPLVVANLQLNVKPKEITVVVSEKFLPVYCAGFPTKKPTNSQTDHQPATFFEHVARQTNLLVVEFSPLPVESIRPKNIHTTFLIGTQGVMIVSMMTRGI